MYITDPDPSRHSSGSRVADSRTKSKIEEIEQFLAAFRKTQGMTNNKAVDNKIAKEVL